ncbi:hypothetical protein TNCV_2579701 [Trichonephila clavipes]|uniref:Uncharacterized protein n=1 Tax=Trichonephila clavipes TaxID=2585209 RepID=A0A8X6SJ52_TRICX|nr:hypothetical protein TNCV_2579701 [Trichonephila clavipes]
MDLVISKHGQVMRATPVSWLLSPNYHTSPTEECSAEEQPIPGWLCGASRYFPATPLTLMRMFTNALSDLGTCQLLDGLRR